MLAAGVAGIAAPRARHAGALGRFLAEFYPLLLTIGLYAHVGLADANGDIQVSTGPALPAAARLSDLLRLVVSGS